jgi:hypothetical protein
MHACLLSSTRTILHLCKVRISQLPACLRLHHIPSMQGQDGPTERSPPAILFSSEPGSFRGDVSVPSNRFVTKQSACGRGPAKATGSAGECPLGVRLPSSHDIWEFGVSWDGAASREELLPVSRSFYSSSSFVVRDSRVTKPNRQF